MFESSYRNFEMKTLIIDLDGTLIDCNSFTEFVKYLFLQLPEARLIIMWIILLRKMRFISHSEAKRRIVALTRKYFHKLDLNSFIHKLSVHIRPSILQHIKSGVRVILATAAPEIYAVPFGESIGISEVFATPDTGAENRGSIKVQNLEKAGVRFSEETTIFTDHYDDLPLLKRNSAGQNILIGPSSTTLMHLKMAGIPFMVED